MRKEGRYDETDGEKWGRKGFAESKYLTVSWGALWGRGIQVEGQSSKSRCPERGHACVCSRNTRAANMAGAEHIEERCRRQAYRGKNATM